MCSGESKVKWLMTEFVFSMNYFFWLLAFKDGSFSDGLTQGLLGAGLSSLVVPPLLKAGSGCPGKERWFPIWSLPWCTASSFSLQNKPGDGGLGEVGERALDLESGRPELWFQLCHLQIVCCRECYMTLVSGLQSEKNSEENKHRSGLWWGLNEVT